MKIYRQGKEENIADSLTQMLEKETGNKIFTLRILNDTDEGLETVVVFEDKSVLMGLITVQTVEGKMAARMQMNYI